MGSKTLYVLVGRISVALRVSLGFDRSCGTDSCKAFLFTHRVYPLLEECMLGDLSLLGSLAVISHIATGFRVI